MNTYRHHLITQTLALLPSKRLICLAAHAAHRQQGTCPPPWRPVKLYQYLRRRQALKWLLDAVARSLRGHELVSFYLQTLRGHELVSLYLQTQLQGQYLPSYVLLHVRTTYLQDLLNHTTEDNPTLNFEDYLSTQPAKPTGPDLQTLPGCI